MSEQKSRENRVRRPAVYPFSYQMQKFSEARRALMAPHPEGETRSFAHAIAFCLWGLNDFDEKTAYQDLLSDDARKWITVVRQTVNKGFLTTGAANNERVIQLSNEQKWEFSSAVENLASYFEYELWTWR